jgi:hypothetical protein
MEEKQHMQTSANAIPAPTTTNELMGVALEPCLLASLLLSSISKINRTANTAVNLSPGAIKHRGHNI